MEYNPAISLLLLVFRIFITIYCVNKAEELNRDKIGWGFFGFFIPIVAVIWIQFVRPIEKYGIYEIEAENEKESFIKDPFIDTYITLYGNRFPLNKVNEIREILRRSDSKKIYALSNIPPISPSKFLYMSFFGGLIGLDRFLIDDVFFGFIKMFTLGGVGVIYIYDIYTANERVKEYNLKIFYSITDSLRT